MSGAFTAVAVAVAAATLTQVFTAIAVVGAVIGVVGKITGVKELQYAGMAMGAVGAIGGFAASAGLFAGEALASTASALGEVTAVASAGSGAGGAYTAAEAMGMAVGFEGAAGIGAAAPVFETIDDVISSIGGEFVGPGSAMAPNAGGIGAGDMPTIGTDGNWTAPVDDILATETLQAQAVPPGVSQSPPVDPLDKIAPGTSGNPAVLEPPPVTTSGGPQVDGTVLGKPGSGVPDFPTAKPSTWYDAGLSGSGGAAQKAVAGVGPATAYPSAPPPGSVTPVSVWSEVMNTIGKPGVGTLLSGAISAGGAFISGATSTLTPAQVRALEAQAGYNQAAANLSKQQARLLEVQQANVTGNIPGVTRTTPVPPGLINQPPQAA